MVTFPMSSGKKGHTEEYFYLDIITKMWHSNYWHQINKNWLTSRSDRPKLNMWGDPKFWVHKQSMTYLITWPLYCVWYVMVTWPVQPWTVQGWTVQGWTSKVGRSKVGRSKVGLVKFFLNFPNFCKFWNSSISGWNPANRFKTGPEPEPDFEAGNPAGAGFSRISSRFLGTTLWGTISLGTVYWSRHQTVSGAGRTTL